MNGFAGFLLNVACALLVMGFSAVVFRLLQGYWSGAGWFTYWFLSSLAIAYFMDWRRSRRRVRQH